MNELFLLKIQTAVWATLVVLLGVTFFISILRLVSPTWIRKRIVIPLWIILDMIVHCYLL